MKLLNKSLLIFVLVISTLAVLAQQSIVVSFGSSNIMWTCSNSCNVTISPNGSGYSVSDSGGGTVQWEQLVRNSNGVFEPA